MYIKYGADRRRIGGQARTCHPPTVKVRLPAYSKVTVANYLRSGTERGLRTRAARPRARSASARRYWIVTQYRAGASRRRTARASPRPPRPRSTTLPGPAARCCSWCPASPCLPDRTGSRSSYAYTRPAGGVYATVVSRPRKPWSSISEKTSFPSAPDRVEMSQDYEPSIRSEAADPGPAAMQSPSAPSGDGDAGPRDCEPSPGSSEEKAAAMFDRIAE